MSHEPTSGDTVSREPVDELAAADAARATTTNLLAFNRHLRHAAGARVLEAPGHFRWITRVPQTLFNGVVCTAPPDAFAPGRVAETVDYFHGEGRSSFSWWLSPEAGEASWTPVLRAQGMERGSEIPGLAVSLDALGDLDPAICEVREVTDAESRSVWARTFVEGFGYPPDWIAPFDEMYRSFDRPGGPLRSYVAFHDGAPVATSTLFLAEGVAGIYDVTTVASARGRGIGTQITLAPLLAGRSAGYRIGVLQASTMGRRVYERMGFRVVCDIEYFVWKERPPA